MTDDNVKAGGISFELRAEFENLATGLAQTQQLMSKFSDQMEDVAGKVESSGKRIASNVDAISTSTLRSGERFARAGAQMIALTSAMSSLQRGAAEAFGKVNVAAQAGAVGLERFITVFGSFPSVTSAVLAVVIGIAEAFVMTSKAIAEIEQHTAELNKRLEANRQKVIASVSKEDARTAILPGAQGDVQKVLDQQTESLEKATLWVHQYQDAIEQAAIKIPQLDERIQALTKRIEQVQFAARAAATAGGSPSGVANEIGDLQEQLKKLVNQKIAAQDAIENLRKALKGLGIDAEVPDVKLKELADRVMRLKEALKEAASEQHIGEILRGLDSIGTIGKREVDLGIITPLQEAQKELAATKNAMRQLLEVQLTLENAANLLSGNPELQEKLRARAAQIADTLGTLQGKAQSDERLVEAKINAGNLASGLSRSIGDAVSTGILQGQKAMEILTNVGQNLFKNMLDKSIDQFEKGMVKAFESIAGQGGELLGTALTGILGVVGGILSRKRGGTQNFASIQSDIQSSEAVRGIVAGPTSVSIAAVVQDLRLATRPVVDKLEEIRLALVNLRFGGGGGGSLPFAGSVSTP